MAAKNKIEQQADKQVFALANRYSQAYLTRDASSLGQILADDWTLITAGCGDEVTKAGQLKDLKSGKLKVEAIEDSDVNVRVYGDAAVVTGVRRSKVYYNKRDVSDVARFTQFYVLRDGKWLCASTQVTSIAAGYTTRSRVMRLATEYSQAYLARDISTLDRILAEDWTLITAGCGDEVNKADQLRDLRDGTLQVDEIEDSEVKVRVYGDAAAVTGLRRSKVFYKKRDVSDLARYTQVYVMRDGEWRCASTQVTSIRPDPDRQYA